MTQIATVRCLKSEKKAEIMVRRQSACGHSCESCGGCGPESATQVFAVANNELGAHPGDTVRVESESRRVLGMAAVLYLFPILLLFVGYFVASGFGLGETGCFLIGLVCMVAGFVVNWLIDRHIRATRPVQFRIVEVLKSCSDM